MLGWDSTRVPSAGFPPDRAPSATLTFGNIPCWDMGYPLGMYPVGISFWEPVLRKAAQLCAALERTKPAQPQEAVRKGWPSGTHCYVFQGVLSDFHRQKQNQERFREQNNIFLEQPEFPLLHYEANNVWIAAFILHLLHLSKEASFPSRRQ